MVARAAARLRRGGDTDPTGAWDDIDADGLATLGIHKAAVAAEIARRALQMARAFRKRGDDQGYRAALRLADAQPRQGIATLAGYALRRLKARV